VNTESLNLKFPAELITLVGTLSAAMRVSKTQLLTELIMSGAYSQIENARDLGVVKQAEIDAVFLEQVPASDDPEVTPHDWCAVYRAYNVLLQKVFSRCPIFRQLLETRIQRPPATQQSESAGDLVPQDDVTQENAET